MTQLVAIADDGRRFIVDHTEQFRDVVGVPCHPDVLKRFQPVGGNKMNTFSGDTVELLEDSRVDIRIRETGDIIPGIVVIEEQS